MKNQKIADQFNEIADLLEIKGENPFRVRAYRRAALNIQSLTTDIGDLSTEEILAVPGIGHDLAAKIGEYLSTGKIKTREDLTQEVPEELLTLLAVPGLGPKTAKRLFEKLGVDSLAELERRARDHSLSGLPGIGDKTEENILRGIEMLRRGRERTPIGKVLPVALDIVAYLKEKAPLTEIEVAGSLRRGRDTIKDIDIVAASDDTAAAMQVFTSGPHVRDVLLSGPTKSTVIIQEGLQVDLRVVEKGSFGAALAYLTGSKAHNVRLREMAVRKGLKINEYGVFREKGGRRLGGDDERDVYRLLGLPFIPPEMREDQGEIEAALRGELPHVLSLEDIRGDLHCHSRWSDGSHTFEELVIAARKLGYSYLAITDHSQGLGIARGLTPERLAEQKKEVAAINRNLKGFRLLQGTEVDIRGDGTIDFPDDVLSGLDLVVASIHSGFRQSREQLTMRLVSAMRNHRVSIIAHPTGRLIGERDPYDVDMEEVLRVARETGTALEINAYPLRLDLNDTYARKAKEMEIPIVISTDSHVTDQFQYMHYGVTIARRAWLEKKDVLNTLPAGQLLKRLKPR